MADYDPADNSRKSYDLAIGYMRGSLVFARCDGSKIELVIGADPGAEVIPLTPEKALDLGVELLTFARPIIRGRLYGNPDSAGLRDGNGRAVFG